MAQLDREPVGLQRLDQVVQLVQPRLAGREGGRELKQKGAELPGLDQRLELEQGALHHRALEVGLEQHPAALVGARVLAQVLGQRVQLRRVAREQPVQLDVEGEAVGGHLGPAPDGVRGGDRVEGRVDLDGLELRRVPGQPLAGGHALRVPLFDEPGVRPARGSDQDPQLRI